MLSKNAKEVLGYLGWIFFGIIVFLLVAPWAVKGFILYFDWVFMN